MRIASIDIGSNTVLLLIAETEGNKIKKTILNEYRMPRISKGLTKEDEISNEKINELLDVLSEYKNIIVSQNCENVILTATAGFRKANNSEQITKMVNEKFGYSIETIDGQMEAKYSFLGASSDLDLDEYRLVIDIGGGSTELIYGNGKEIKYSNSFPFGAVNITEKLITSYPVDEITYQSVAKKISDIFKNIQEYIPKKTKTIAVAGTPTTLSCIKKGLKEYDEKEVEFSILSDSEINKLIEDFKPQTPDEILENYGNIVNGRNDVILTGATILSGIMNRLELDEILCSGKGIRYGAIIYYLQNLNKN